MHIEEGDLAGTIMVLVVRRLKRVSWSQAFLSSNADASIATAMVTATTSRVSRSALSVSVSPRRVTPLVKRKSQLSTFRLRLVSF